ncbi:MAG: 50S ribosomal protein L14 [Euryarchaeota archaeon]|nr:50S ribosomal protein L14 [Euryarchaeota archaeon]MEC8735381.1 50S ribosomal protein L14 [Candidatus Thermoplasmatota archaeon]|tara:strand:+ start:636 stop:1034 length:399 start_codon:yes stop_codon:yes gene_type:complete
MRGIAGRQTRGLPTGARLLVADNTGAKEAMLINVIGYVGTMRRNPAGGVGDMLKVSIKKGSPSTRRQMFNAIIVRQRRPFRRVDGTWVQFEDNACVITNEKGEVQGSDIKGPVAREAAERWPRIAATAKQII